MPQISKWFKDKLPKAHTKKDRKQPIQSDPPSVPDQSEPDPKSTPSPGAGIEPKQLQGQLWNKAYDELKSNNAEVVETYERILSCELPRSQQESSDSASPENRIDATHDERWKQMQIVVEAVLERTKKKVVKKQRIGNGLTAVGIAMNQAVRAAPEAAVAWTGVCFALEMLSNHIKQVEINHEGVAYIVSRMDWYWHLSDLLLDGNKNISAPSILRIQMEKHIVDLYRKILLYQMKSVCRYYRRHGPPLLRETIKVDDWNGQLDDIRNAETAVKEDSRIFSGFEIQRRLGEIDSASHVLRSEIQGIWSMLQENILSKEEEQCLRDLRVTDPRDDKYRIEDTNGGLLQGACDWIIRHSDYVAWRNESESRLLWIKGDPGKGKTMLMCGIIDELKGQDIKPCYFFCQATDPRLNNATAVLRGLLYILLDTNRHFLAHIQEKYGHAGTGLFNDINSWTALSKIFTKILEDPSLVGQLFMIDALDECVTDLEHLLDLIVSISNNSQVKWIVSSRNWTEIEAKFGAVSQRDRLSLELNEQSVSEAVLMYINHKAARLKEEKGIDDETELNVREYLTDNARGTFLWVALVCKELLRLTVRKRHVLKKMAEFPPQLGPLYERMMQQIRESEDFGLCEKILRLAAVVYRPVSLAELASLLDISDNSGEELEEIVTSCGSFLVVRKEVVRFVHQSAKDFLFQDDKLVSKIGSQHYEIFSRSLDILSATLQCDMYNLRHPGALVLDHIPNQNQEVLKHALYSCAFWADHLKAANDLERERCEASLQEGGIVHIFLREKLLNWLEALSLIQSMPDGARAVGTLAKLTKNDKGIMRSLVKDVYRFVFSHKTGIELAPLQVYTSALIFSPTSSIIRQLYEETEMSKWIIRKPSMPLEWTACIQSFQSPERTTALAFSPDGTQLASVDLRTLKIWDLETGACLHTFESYFDEERTVVFSYNGMHVAVGSRKAVDIWCLTTSTCLTTIQMDRALVMTIAFSPDGTRLVAIFAHWARGIVKVWHIGTGRELETRDIGDIFNSGIFFAQDGTLFVWAAHKGKLNIHNITATNHQLALDIVCNRKEHYLFRGESHWFTTGLVVTVSADAAWLAVTTCNDHSLEHVRILIFDLQMGADLQIIDTKSSCLSMLTFSTDRARLVSYHQNSVLQIWDRITGACLQRVNMGLPLFPRLFAFSPAVMLAAEASSDKEFKIWDMTVNDSIHASKAKAHTDRVLTVLISPDGTQLATSSGVGAIKMWDLATGICLKQFGELSYNIGSMVFFPDGIRLALGRYGVVETWEISSGVRLGVIHLGDFESHTIALTISSQCNIMAVASFSGYYIEMWKLTTSTSIRKIYYSKDVNSLPVTMSFSSDDTRLGLVFKDGTALIYDANTGIRLHIFSRFFNISREVTPYEPPLRSDLLVFDIQSLASNPSTKQIQDSSQRLKLSGFDICPEMTWILRGQERVLWLHPEYRPCVMAFAADELDRLSGRQSVLSPDPILGPTTTSRRPFVCSSAPFVSGLCAPSRPPRRLRIKSLQAGAAADQPPKPPNIPPQKSSRLPSNIPLRTLPSRFNEQDFDQDSPSASLLSTRGYGAPHHNRPSSESETSSWTDTGDIGDQYGDEHDPVRIQLPEDIENELLAGVQRRQSKPLFKSQKKVRIHDPSPHRRNHSLSPSFVFDKEAIEIPDTRPRPPTRAERCIGSIMAGSSGSIHGLTGKALLGPYFIDYFNHPSKAEVGTMVAILEIGAFISSLIVGRVGDIIGRRRTILYGSCIFFIGGALQTLATSMAMMMVGRIVAGFGVGMLSTIVPVYQSEISPPHNRGKLACIEFSGNIIGYTTSVWVDYGCGFIESNLSWRIPLMMQCIMGALLGLGSLIIVESPRWLLDNDHDEEGMVVIANLYGGGDIHNAKARDEYREIKMNVLLQRQEGERTYADMFRRYRTRVFIAMSAQALAQLNGINVISYYAPYVFESAGWVGHDAVLMTGLNGITYFLSTIPPWYLVDRWGRRMILLTGAVFMALSLSLISYFLYLDIGWTPRMVVLFVMIYNAAFGYSWGPIPWLYPPEILPLSIRSKGASLSTATNWAFNWLVGEMTPILQEWIKWRLYLVHAFFCAASFVIVYFVYPETCGVRLEDMDSIFGDASTVATPSIHAETGSLIQGGSPIGSGRMPFRSTTPIPGLSLDGPDVNDNKSVSQSGGDDRSISGWISRVVNRGRSGSPSSGQGRYTPLGQQEDEGHNGN
ncbi:high-affinity glucose transporter [Trichoderma arundinaceum]|uniref:High-affinity glucose transporter n=1 Tax=Trichoderma arundinaceum TaxID=490622 RepID=A0A395NYY5_TRIAR|nr:high-affinity glucose transporter [Trichoderma arundinaceum]